MAAESAEQENLVAKIKATAGLILDEYLMTENGMDAASYVEELKAGNLKPEVVKRLLICALDKTEGEQEVAAGMISSLCVRCALEPADVEAGLELLLKRLEDLVLDVPKVVDYVARFVAHLLEDKTVPESLLASVPALAGERLGKQLLESVSTSLKLPLAITTVKQKVRAIIEEYFVAGELREAEERLVELGAGRSGHEVVKRTLVVAMEKKNRERERASVLLSAITRVYGSEQFFEGFIHALRSIDDLALDTPNAALLLANFIARAIVDDVLPPVFISLVPERLVAGGRGAEVAVHVKALLEQHSSTRIMNVWGSGAKNSVDELKESVKALVDEYFSANDLPEALRCVQELDAPAFGHEVVKRIVYRGVEVDKSREAVALLKGLLAEGILDHVQLTNGMQRAVKGLPDLCLDVPDAPERLRTVADLLAFENLVSPAFEQAVLLKTKQRSDAQAPPSIDKVRTYASFIVEEFLVCESARDAAASVQDLAAPSLHPELVRSMLRLAMDKTPAQRAQVGDMVSSLCVRGALEAGDVEAGLELLLKRVEDLALDVPKIEEDLGHFLAHFLEDRTLPENFLASVPGLAGAERGQKVVEAVKAKLSLPLQVTVVKQKVRAIVEEYFVAGELREAEERLVELGAGRSGHEVVKRTLVVAMEKKNRERERASVLLSAITRVYGSEQFFEGFIHALRSIDDLALDTPNAALLLANFIARAIVDDVLPPVFISLVPERLVAGGRGAEVAVHVKALLEQHSSTRIMNVWGSGAKNSVDELKESVKALVDEYFSANDLPEALRCVQELDAPLFGHEVVKQIVYRGVEKGGASSEAALALLAALVKAETLPAPQVHKGMTRALLGLADLCLDVPDAKHRISSLLNAAVQQGLVPATMQAHLSNLETAIPA